MLIIILIKTFLFCFFLSKFWPSGFNLIVSSLDRVFVLQDIFFPMSSSSGLHDVSSNKTLFCIFTSFYLFQLSSSCGWKCYRQALNWWWNNVRISISSLQEFESIEKLSIPFTSITLACVDELTDGDLEAVHPSLGGDWKQGKGCAGIVEGVDVVHGHVEEVVQGRQGDV